jgi:hypothetical protein
MIAIIWHHILKWLKPKEEAPKPKKKRMTVRQAIAQKKKMMPRQKIKSVMQCKKRGE